MRLTKSDDYQPIAWIGRYPLHAPAILVIIHTITMFVTTALIGLKQGAILDHLVFSSTAVSQRFEIWQFVTYAFVNPPNFWWVIEMFMLYSFGIQIERFIGRRDFLALYGFLLILPPCALMAIGTFMPVAYSGSQTLHYCIFIAFAVLYPTVELLFTIQARWIAGCFLAIDVLQMLASQAWVRLLILSLSAFTAFYFIGRLRYGFTFLSLSKLGVRLPTKRPSASPAPSAPKRTRKEDLSATVDQLLEKISRTGIASLTEKEREQLSRASEALKRAGTRKG